MLFLRNNFILVMVVGCRLIYKICMSEYFELSGSDRDFFGRVAEAAFANPFSEARRAIDRDIAGLPSDADWEEAFFAVVAESARRLDGLPTDIRKYDERDARVLSVGLLFVYFHEYMAKFDSLIQQQEHSPDEYVSADFTESLFDQLVKCGFARQESARYVAIFFQMRRAFYFINRGLIGKSRCMQQLRERMWQNLFTCRTDWYEGFLWNCMEDFSTLLHGETGTGKGAVAAAIGRSGFIPYNARTHQFTVSFVKVFIPINLSQFSALLIESELFGHRKGAFTGAMDPHEGVFARCSEHGAIFLDEIGEVSLPVQIKLLKVLQERVFSPVGSHEGQRFSGRVIAATNQSIDALRASGAMRDDFYYRLCSDEITVPSLRQRIKEDPRELGDLVGHILGRLCSQNADGLKPSVLSALKKCVGKNYGWPGNVRELEQAVRRVLLTGTYDPQPVSAGGLESKMQRGEWTAKELTAHYCRELYDQLGNFGEVARRLDLDWRTVKKHVNGG